MKIKAKGEGQCAGELWPLPWQVKWVAVSCGTLFRMPPGNRQHRRLSLGRVPEFQPLVYRLRLAFATPAADRSWCG